MRIQGITLPDNKRLEIALTAIFGIGRPRAMKILKDAGVDHGKKPTDISDDEENKLRTLVEEFTIEGELKREVAGNIKRFKDINSYRGSRHAKHLPANGQNTKTNGRTVRGNVRKTMGSGRKSVEKK